MALGTGVLSRRFYLPFWKRPFGCLTSPPWKVKPTNVVMMQNKTAWYCNGVNAAKSLHAIHCRSIISNFQNPFICEHIVSGAAEWWVTSKRTCYSAFSTVKCWAHIHTEELQASAMWRKESLQVFNQTLNSRWWTHFQPDEELIRCCVSSWRPLDLYSLRYVFTLFEARIFKLG